MAKKKKQTLKEFKAWMDGVEELQPDDWCPTSEQWALIRSKIDNIIEEKPAPAAPAALGVPTSTQYPTKTIQPNTALIPPPIVGGISAPSNLHITDAAKEIMNSGNTKSNTGEHAENTFE